MIEAKAKNELPACPVETTLTLIGDKWKVLILRDLMPGTKRFGVRVHVFPGGFLAAACNRAQAQRHHGHEGGGYHVLLHRLPLRAS